MPSDWRSATLLGRAWIPGSIAGPSPITVRPDGTVIDLAPICPTVSLFLEQDDAAAAVRALAPTSRAIGSIDDLLSNSRPDFDDTKPRLLAPCDLQAIKAAGVTFVASTLERVIEEQARGAPERAAQARAEVESALVAHPKVAEAAVVGYPHDIKGQGIYAYVTLMTGTEPSEELRKELVQWVRKEIGPIASPDLIQFAPSLPKTRSGKIMRRILRKIAEDEYTNLGDTSTLADPMVVDDLVDNRQNKKGAAAKV